MENLTIEQIDEQIVLNRNQFFELKKLRERKKNEGDISFFESLVGKYFFCERNDAGYESFVSVKREENEIIFYEIELDNYDELSNSVDYSKQKLSNLNIGKIYFENMYIEIEKDLYLTSTNKLNKFIEEAIKDA